MTAWPRVTCPVCERRVAVIPPRGVISTHKDPDGPGYSCAAAGTLTARDAHRADLRRLAELIRAYPEQARKMVARLGRDPSSPEEGQP